MSLPSDLYSLVVTGSYRDPVGAALPGTITFTPSTSLVDATGSVEIPAYARPYQLSAGQLRTDPLVANDNANLLPANSTYTVTVALQNLQQTSYSVVLAASPFSFTATNATPAVITAAGSAYANGAAVMLTGASVPPGFTAGTTYYVVSVSGTSFSLAATSGGSAIASTGTGSGMVSTASVDISTLTPVTPQGTPLFYVPTTGGTYSGTVTLDGSPPLVIPSGGYVPQTQSFALANLAAENSFNFTITGQTDDPLPAFGVLANSRTYGGIQGPVSWFGYNPVHAQAGGSSSHSSAVLSFFADAGDTNSSGAHGVEINLSWFSPDYSKACGAFQMVAVDDNTGTLHTILRCGTGTSGAYTSFIAFQDASAATTFMSMDESSSSIWTYVPFAPKGGNPFTVQASSGNTNVLFTTGGTASASTVVTIAATGASGTAELILNGNNGSGANGEILFQTNGTTQWELAGTPPYLYIKDIVNNRSALYMYPGSTAAASNFQVNSKLQSLSSLIVGSAALTTTATDGFLYLPTCAGVPTGTPTAQTGTSAAVYDTTDNKLYVYNGGWKSAALS